MSSTASRRIAGRLALGHGHALEHRLAFMCEQYGREGKAWIRRSGTKARAMKTATGELRFIAEQSPVDFWGVISGGRLVAFDAKSVDQAYSWRLRQDQMHQYDMLADLATLGALCFFAVESRPHHALFLLRVPSRRTEIWPHVRAEFCSRVGGGGDDSEGRPVPQVIKQQSNRQLYVPEDDLGRYDFLPPILERWLGRRISTKDANGC